MLCIERLFGLACQGNEGSVHPFTLHTAMRRTVPSWLGGQLAYLEGSAEQPFSAGSVLASARVVPDQRCWRALDIAFNTTSLGEWEPALSAGIQVSISITCNQIRCSAALHTHHIIQSFKKRWTVLQTQISFVSCNHSISSISGKHITRKDPCRNAQLLTYAACIVHTVCQMKKLWQINKTTTT